MTDHRRKRIELGVAAEVDKAPIITLWRERFIVGTLNLVAGTPGVGKSQLTATVAADLSRQGFVGILSNVEDDVASVTVPRLEAANADLSKVHLIDADEAPVFPRDFDLLEAAIRATGSSYFIADPIAAHFHPERWVNDRPRLRALAAVGRRTRCAIIAVHHTTKLGEVGGPNAGLRGTSRAVYIYGFDPEDEDRRVLAVDKVNGITEPPAILFEQETVDIKVGRTTIEAGRLHKVRQVNTRAAKRRAQPNRERDAAAHKWLSEFLATGEDCARPSVDVIEQGREAGFGQATLNRAKVTLQVEHFRMGGWGSDGHWTWRLPDEHPLRNRPEAPDPGEAT